MRSSSWASAKAAMRIICLRPIPRGVARGWPCSALCNLLIWNRAISITSICTARRRKLATRRRDRAIIGLFGTATPCSSIKGFTGHTLGASGVIEAIVSLLALTEGFLPGTAGTQDFDPQMKAALLRDGKNAAITHVMSNSFGFGGSNCSMILGRA